jgi:hypothetical protein
MIEKDSKVYFLVATLVLNNLKYESIGDVIQVRFRTNFNFCEK